MPYGGLLDRGRVVAGREREVAGVDDGVAEGEDALVAAAEARRRVEEEDNGDEEDGAPHLTDDLKHYYYLQGAVWLNTVSFYDLMLGLCTPDPKLGAIFIADVCDQVYQELPSESRHEIPLLSR